MKSPQFTLYLLCFFWTIGIVFSFYFRAPLPLLLGISFFLALFLLLNIKRNPIPLWGKSILFYLLTLCLAFTQGLQKQKLSPQHFLRNYIPGDSVQLRLMLFEKLRSSENQMRFYAMVKSKNGIPTNGKLLLNIRTEKKLPLQLGNILEIKTVILPLDEPKNPGEFHYKNYLKTQGVYAKLSFVPPKKIMSISSDSSWILKIKARAVQKIVESSFSTESKGLILAMLLGERNTIPREKMNEFGDAGILHI